MAANNIFKKEQTNCGFMKNHFLLTKVEFKYDEKRMYCLFCPKSF